MNALSKSILLVLIVLLQHLLAKSYSIDRYDISIQISDCSPLIQEKFYLTFTGGTYSSFVRSVPITDFSDVSNVENVTDESMNSYEPTVRHSKTDSGITLSNIQWTFPDTSGSKIFSLTYRATGLIKSQSSTTGVSENTFSWIVGGEAWSVPLHNLSTTVNLNSALTEEEVSVTPRYETFATTLSGTSIYFFKKEHQVRDLLRITLTFPERYSRCNSSINIGYIVACAVAFAIAICGFVLVCMSGVVIICTRKKRMNATGHMDSTTVVVFYGGGDSGDSGDSGGGGDSGGSGDSGGGGAD